LSTGSDPSRAEVAAAIRHAVRRNGGTRGCAVALAGEYGEHPEIAMSRMRWALGVIQVFYARRARASPTAGLANPAGLCAPLTGLAVPA
jgi:hypothetical protein